MHNYHYLLSYYSSNTNEHCNGNNYQNYSYDSFQIPFAEPVSETCAYISTNHCRKTHYNED